jgi:four helix bundle protein
MTDGTQRQTRIRSFRDLLVWQKGVDLVVETYKLTERLPKHEAFGLKLQMQRAAVSVPSNISEGHARGLTGEYLHHLAFAAGSVAELETQFEICVRLEYLKRDELAKAFKLCDEISRMLQSLIRRLKGIR